jgi:hypothetical protein
MTYLTTNLSIDISASRSMNSSSNSTIWRIVFHNADYRFPLMSIVDNTVVCMGSPGDNSGPTTYSAAFDTRWVTKANRLAGSFILYHGSEATPPLAYDSDEETIANALEALPSIELASVTRTSVGLNEEYQWDITFFYSTVYMHKYTPLLKANGSNLVGDVEYTVPLGDDNQFENTMSVVIPPNVTVMSQATSSGRPLVYRLATKASYKESVLELVMRSDLSKVEMFYFNITR